MAKQTSGISIHLLVLLLAGCEQRGPLANAVSSSGATVDVPATSTAAAPVRPTLTPQARMEFHAREADMMRRAVIAGDLSAASVEAKALSEDKWTPRLKPTWRSHMQAMYGAARAYDDASNIGEGAGAVAQLARACAGCHNALGGPNPATYNGQPPEPSMGGHAWAAERLWFGLMAPSEAAWAEGARQLAKPAPFRSDVTAVDAQAKRLQQLGASAMTVASEHRARVFSDVLTTCADCHRRVGYAP